MANAENEKIRLKIKIKDYKELLADAKEQLAANPSNSELKRRVKDFQAEIDGLVDELRSL